MDQQPKIRGQKKRLYKKYIIVIALVVIVISSLIYMAKLELSQKGNFAKIRSCQTTEYTGDFTVKLKSRQFLPEAEIGSGLDWLRGYSGQRAHVLLQPCKPLNSSTKILLEKSDIHLLNYIPSNTWFASIPKNLKQDDHAFEIVRWFGSILPEDKIGAHLLEGNVGSWALRERNKVALQISFFKDVSLDDAKKIIQRLNGEIVNATPISNKLIVKISRDAVQILAKDDSVRWVDTIPPSPVTNIE